jgi:hypothetical protein
MAAPEVDDYDEIPYENVLSKWEFEIGKYIKYML